MSTQMKKISLGDGKVTYFRAKEMSIGQKVNGRYVKQLTDKFGNPAYKLELANGTIGILNSTGQLASLFEKVSIGDNVEVIYQGTSEIETGKWAGTEAHVFEVFSDGAGNSTNDALPA